MANKIPQQITAPITWQTPIVKQDGTMTEPMRRLVQALTGNGSNSTDVVQQLVDAELQQGSGIGILPDGHLLSNPTISAKVQEILDQVSNVRGVLLYRGASGWAALAPGTSGLFLETQGAGMDPTWAAASANIQTLLDGISSTQGVILYRSASAWVALAPGTSGNFLQTLGAGANPAWAASPTIQVLLDGISSTRGVVLYRGASGWAALSPGTSGNILQTNGAGADPTWVTPSVANIQTLLDGISSTQGVILYRSASAWVALAPGTSGNLLQTNGAGANPTWVPPPSAGGGAWAFISTNTISSGVASVAFTGLGAYSELLLYCNAVTTASSGTRGVQLSTDNGSTYVSSYSAIEAAGTLTSTTKCDVHTTAATAARSGVIMVQCTNLASHEKFLFRNLPGQSREFVTASLAAVDAIRLINDSGNLTGGSVSLFGR